MRLIDGDTLREEFWTWGEDIFADKPTNFEFNSMLEVIDEAPTVDAVEVVHGSWRIVMEYEDHAELECGECHMPTDTHYFGNKIIKPHLPNYCQSCGAKMDKAVEG